MRVLGKINIMGTDVYQVSTIPNFDILNASRDLTEDEEIIKKCKVGSYIFSDPLNAYEKREKGRFIRTTYRIMMMNMLTWGITLLESSESFRKQMLDLTYKGIESFNQEEVEKATQSGNKSKVEELKQDGEDAVSFLKEDCEVIGFVPAVTYIMPKSRGEGSLTSFWEHPFSIPTIALKHKKFPFIILTNGNLNFDESKLVKIWELSGNIDIEGLEDGVEIEKPQDGLGILG